MCPGYQRALSAAAAAFMPVPMVCVGGDSLPPTKQLVFGLHTDLMAMMCANAVRIRMVRCSFSSFPIRIQRAVPTSSYLRRIGFVFVFGDGGDRP